MVLNSKVERLVSLLEKLPGAMVAYSGGADSAYLSEMSYRVLGDRSTAVTADSPSLPRRELKQAIELATQRGWTHQVVATLEITDENYTSNPHDRCYFCKSALFDQLAPKAEAIGVPILLGTNLDDLGDWRPGQVAASERGALSPLVDAGFTKEDVRRASASVGLVTADKPASACLASRFAYGVAITEEGLARVEGAEDAILARGFTVVRVRDLGQDRARVEVGAHEVSRLDEMGPDLISALMGLGFRKVSLDEQGYRQGSLNDGIEVELIQVGKRR
ncbi:MAG: ATP-dependent sacrificial sulfur transferase LarE [Actinobacteria bacterium]|nr:ATP-dependent sacrificial sulfur transferase LarE [Actinomycetota bacterium]